MASANLTCSDLESTKNRLRKEILSKFSELQKALEDRKSVLLAKLDKIFAKNEKIPEVEVAIQQLERFKEQGLKLLVSNLIPDNENIDAIDKQIADLKEKRVPNSDPIRFYQIRHTKSWLFSETLSNIQLIPGGDYSQRQDPILKLYNKGSSLEEFNIPLGICIDNLRNEIYVCDSMNERICIFDLNCRFSRIFNMSPIRYPRGVHVTLDSVYIANDYLHTVAKYDLNGKFLFQKGKCGRGKEEFKVPINLKGHNDLIYVCEMDNNRIQVLDPELNFHSMITHSDMLAPTDIHISEEFIYVLTRGSTYLVYYTYHGKITLFSLGGEYVREIMLSGQNSPIQEAFFFTLDEQNNFLISDKIGECVKVFSFEGNFEQNIGEGHLHYPRGIVAIPNSKIVLVCENEQGCLQMY